MEEQFPIHCTCPGPRFGKVAEECFTHNPIPEGTKFQVQHGKYVVWFQLDSHFFTDMDLSTVKVVKVTKRGATPCRPILTKSKENQE